MKIDLIVSAAAAALACAAIVNPAIASSPVTTTQRSTNTLATRALPQHLARGSLVDAISAVEHDTGGKILEIRFISPDRTSAGYDAVVAMPDKSVRYLRYRTTGGIMKSSQQVLPRSGQDFVLREDARSIQKASVSLIKSVKEAERADDGPAVAVRLNEPLTPSNDVLAYDVRVLGHRNVLVDARDSRIIADAQALAGPWTPEQIVRQDIAERREHGQHVG